MKIKMFYFSKQRLFFSQALLGSLCLIIGIFGTNNLIAQAPLSFMDYVNQAKTVLPLHVVEMSNDVNDPKFEDTPDGILNSYTDRTTLINACGSTLKMEDFAGANFPIGSGFGPMNNANGGNIFPNGELIEGFNIDSDPNNGGNNLSYISPVLGLGNAFPGVCTQLSADKLEINFPANDVNVVGFRIVTIFGGGTANISFFGAGNVHIQTFNGVTAANGFFGVIADETITRVTLQDPSGGFIYLMQLEFGACGGCDIDLTSVDKTHETCPGANDGTITINATCTTCASIEYSKNNSDWQSENLFEDVAPGTYTVYVRDAGDHSCNDKQNNVTINVGVDNENPTISCPGDFYVPTDLGLCTATLTLPLPMVDDNCGIAILEFRYIEVDQNNNHIGSWSPWTLSTNNTITEGVGRWKIRWRVKDPSGNKKGCTDYFDIVDNENPMANCHNPTIQLSGGQASISINDINNNSSDNCGIMSLSTTPSQLNFDCSHVGEQLITLLVEDVNGLVDECVAMVTVESATEISISDLTKMEGTGNGFTFFLFPVTRSDNDCTFAVDYASVDGTAMVAANDYQAINGALYFPAGGSFTQYAIVRVVRDAIAESEENFFVDIFNATNGVNILQPFAEGTIIDDDAQPLIGNEEEFFQNAIATPLEVNKVIAYPNPVVNLVNIRIPEWWFEQGTVQASLYDGIGRQMAAFELTTAQSSFDFSQMESGNYYLSLVPANGTRITKLIVKD